MTPIDWVELSWAELRWAWVQPQRPKGPLNLAACIVNICNQNKYAWDAALLWPRPHSDWEMRMQLQLLGKCNHRRRHVATNVINLATVPRPLKKLHKEFQCWIIHGSCLTQDTGHEIQGKAKWQVASGKWQGGKWKARTRTWRTPVRFNKLACSPHVAPKSMQHSRVRLQVKLLAEGEPETETATEILASSFPTTPRDAWQTTNGS